MNESKVEFELLQEQRHSLPSQYFSLKCRQEPAMMFRFISEFRLLTGICQKNLGCLSLVFLLTISLF